MEPCLCICIDRKFFSRVCIKLQCKLICFSSSCNPPDNLRKSFFFIQKSIRNCLALNHSSIDLFIRNSPFSFQNVIVISNGISNGSASYENGLKKYYPIKRYYTDYKYFDHTKCKNDLPYMTKTLRPTIILRYELETKY